MKGSCTGAVRSPCGNSRCGKAFVIADASPPDPQAPPGPDEPADLLEAVARRLRDVPAAADGTALPFERWEQLRSLVRVRRERRPDTPWVTALIGPTGAGKSTITNWAVGREVSPSGAIRPTTARPFVIGGESAWAALGDDPFLREAQAEFVAIGDEFGNHLLVDTPDFDSIEDLNRDRAWLFLLRADRTVVVLNPEKYGDASVRETLEELQRLGSVAATVFNKSRGSEAFADCRDRLVELGFPPPIEAPRVDDANQAAPEDLQRALREALVPSTIPEGWLERRANAAMRLERELRDATFTPWRESIDGALSDVSTGLEELEKGSTPRLSSRLPLKLEEALRRELVRTLEEQVRRYDPLREPRRWIREAVSWLWRSDDSKDAAPSTAAWLTDQYYPRFWELSLETHSEVQALIDRARTASRPTLQWPQPEEPQEDAVRASLLAVCEDLCAELVRETERITEGLGIGSKVTFFGSQAAVHSLMILVFVKTGGLSPTELVAQGLMSPLLASVAERLVATGELTAVEERLGARFADQLLAALSVRWRDTVRGVSELRSAVPTTDEWSRAIEEWEAK